MKKKHKLSKLNERYRVKRKGLKTVIEELKQRILAKSAKVRRYQKKIEQFKQNRIFDLDQKKMYTRFNGDGVRPSHVPNAEESINLLPQEIKVDKTIYKIHKILIKNSRNFLLLLDRN